MSEWITDRPPTEADGGILGAVYVTENGSVLTYGWKYVAKENLPWMPMMTPEPYQPPKPRRREWWLVHKPNGFDIFGYYSEQWMDGKPIPYPEQAKAREVLPGDPDPDEAIELKRRCESLSCEISNIAFKIGTGKTNCTLAMKRLEEIAAKLRLSGSGEE